MMETSTPQRPHFNRRSILNVSVVSSPLRRSVLQPAKNAALLEPADDEQERSTRRSIVEIRRRLTNITSSSTSPLVDTAPYIEESQIKDHLRICAKLYTENKISAKNAWQLHVIDVMRRISLQDNANVLQVAGSSLDIGAKVYGLRVDDVYSKGLQLASSMGKSSEKQSNQEGDENINEDAALNQTHAQRRRNAKKKTKKLAADKRNTVDKDEKNLYATIKHVESVIFATKESIDISAIDNLFTHKLPTNPANHRFMLLSEDKYWPKNFDETLQNPDKLLEVEYPQVTHFNMCLAFKDFETGNWDPEEEERLLTENPGLTDAVLDDNGLPIAELDGSVHDIFEDNNDVPDDPHSDGEENHEEVFQAQIHGEIAHIVDAVPEENRIETEYGYNTLIKTTSGKYIDKIWAGPSHWKVKFNRRSSSRYSGSCIQQVVRHTKKNKEPQKIIYDRSQLENDVGGSLGKYAVKRAPPTTTFEKITLPIPEIEVSPESFKVQTEELLIKPGVRRPRLNNNFPTQRDYEVQVYNYENPNDSQYCSQHNSDDGNDGEPLQNSFEEDLPPAAQEQFLGENLITAPEIVSSTHLPYAMQAKKMDMKKLKAAVWKCLTTGNGKSEEKIKPTEFSSLYGHLPQLLTTDMKRELTCPLAVVALLHLCNENNLELKHEKNYKDFTILKAYE